MFNWKLVIFGGLSFVGGVLICSAITNILIRKKAMAEAEKIYIDEVEFFKKLWIKNHPESLEKIESEEADMKFPYNQAVAELRSVMHRDGVITEDWLLENK